mgnify:CR=1 FL=1
MSAVAGDPPGKGEPMRTVRWIAYGLAAVVVAAASADTGVFAAETGAATDIAIRLTPSAKIPLRSLTMLRLPMPLIRDDKANV